jgi:hypothetical protein
MADSAIQFSVSAVTALACLLSIVRGGKNEKEDIASLDIAFGRLSLRRMRNNSWHRGRYTEGQSLADRARL